MEPRRRVRLCSMQSPPRLREEMRCAFVASALEARQDVARRGRVMAAAAQPAPSSIRTSICGVDMTIWRARKVARSAWLISLTAAR